MAEYNFPALTAYLGNQTAAAPNQDAELLAEQGRQYLSAVRPPAAAPQRNLFTAGLSAGIDELQGLGGAAVSAVGKAIGAEGLANWGAEVARRNEEESAASGRPDLETAPWKEGGAPVLSWLGYQAAKQVPQLTAYFAGGALMPEIAVPAGLARIGMAVPGILGGGRGIAAKVAQEAVAKGVPESVAAFTGKRAGLEAGKEYAREFLGAAAVGAPLGAGSMYQEALDRGGATQGEALAALALGPAYGALEAVQPTQLATILKKGMTGNLGKRLLTGVAIGAAGEAPTEATQTAMEQAFRPDVPMADKAQAVIDAALTGAAVGGVFGGGAGAIGKARPATVNDPGQAPITSQSSTDDIQKSVDQVLQLEYKPQQAGPMFVDTQGVAAQSLYESQQARQAAAEVQAAQQEAAARQEQIQALSPQPATQLALPAPPPVPVSVQEQFNALSDKDIISQLESYEKLVKNKKATPADEQTVRFLRAEQDRRAGKIEGAAPVAEQPSMFAEADLSGAQQPLLTTQPAPVVTPEMETIRATAKDLIESKKDTAFTKNLLATDAVSLVRAAQDYANANPNNDGGASLLLEKLNVADPVKLGKDISKLEKKLVDLKVKALTNRATQTQIETVEGQLDTLNQSKSLLDAVEQSRAGTPSLAAEAQQGALPAEVSPPASQAGLPLFPEIAPARRKGQQGEFNLEGMPKSQLFQQLNTVAQNQKVPTTIRRMAGSAARAVRSGALDAQTQAIQALRAIESLNAPEYNLAQPEVAPQVQPQTQPATPQISLDELRFLAGIQAPVQEAQTAFPETLPETVQTIQPAAPQLIAPQIVSAQPASAPIQPRTQAQVQAQRAAQQQAPAGGQPPSPPKPPVVPASPAPSQGPGPASVQGDVFSRAIDRLIALRDQYVSPELKAKSLRQALFWYGLNGIVRTFDPIFNGKLSEYMTAVESQRRVRNVWQRLVLSTQDMVNKLERNNPEAHKLLAKLMTYTESNLRPGLSWAEHTWLQGDPNAQQLQVQLAEANKIYRKLKKDGWLNPKDKTANAIDVYERLIANNETDAYARQAVLNYLKLAGDPRINEQPGFNVNPMIDYLSSLKLHDDPMESRKYWQRVLAAQTTSALNAAGKDKSRADIKKIATENTELAKTLSQGAYFHLGREGNYMISFKFKEKNGAPDSAAVNQFRDALDAQGLNQFEISKMPGKNNVFLRLENENQRETVIRILKDMTARKLVDGNFKTSSKDGMEGDIDSLKSAAQLANVIRESIESRIARTADPEVQTYLKNKITETTRFLNRAALELVPENSMATVLARRKNVSGYSADMFRNAAYRSKVTADALSNLAFYPDKTKAMSDIAVATRIAGQAKDGQIDTDAVRKLEAVRDELAARMYEDTGDATKSFLEYMRPVGYIYYLTSPASAALQLASVPTFAWPRLGARYGFVKSARAFAKTAKTAIKIVNAAVKHGMDSGLFRAFDIFFDAEALKSAGLDEATAEYILKVANTTAIEFGSMSRELGRLASSNKNTAFDRALAMAGFMNNYTETLSRIWTALAVKELAPANTDVVAEAKEVIDRTIFDFSTDKEPRAYGQKGILKQYSPVALQFTKINSFIAGELYREAKTAFASVAQTEAQKKEARRFLAGHITAMAALTGTLGLPFAASIATAINQIAGALGDDDEPYDVQVAWRNWLAGALGKDVGEVVARGLPRAVGLDISERVGEANLLPFSRFLSDRRKFEDKFNDLITNLAGAPIGAVASMATGMSQMANGDVLQGMQSFLPSGLRAPVQAYVLGSKGYTDKSGNVIPLDPGALDILYQAIGFKPAEKAEYDEARMAQLSRESVLTRKAGDLRRRLATAIEDNDVPAQQKLLQQAKTFDTSNPAYAVIPSLESAIKQRAKARALTESLGVTFGTNIRDIGSIEAQGFANIGR